MIFLSYFLQELTLRFFSAIVARFNTKEAVAYMDIDLSADPNELSILSNHIHNNDVVI
jgi:hypothetical protein